MAKNKVSVLTQFVKENFVFLTSMDFDRKLYKALHRKFFYEKYDRKFGYPSVKEVCDFIIRYQKKSGIQSDVIIQQIEVLPIFKQLGESVRESFIELLKQQAYKSGISQEDMKAIKAGGAFHAVIKHQERKVIGGLKDKVKLLEKKVEKKQQEYDSLESVLEKEEIPEPEFDPETEDVKPWWERFYLKDNPFPRKDGLSAIDEELYDSIVVKTKPFKIVLSSLERDINYFFNTAFLLIGDFGFGKTTFMDYLTYYLIQRKVLPLRIASGRSFPDSRGFMDNFYLKLRVALFNELPIREPVSEKMSSGLDVEGQILELVHSITTRYAGIVVFLDDYHKHRSSYSSIYEFLGALQILKDNFSRKQMTVGFVVSGVPEWKTELPKNPQMSGFFDSGLIEMPTITANSVCNVFNQRICAYCYDRQPRKLRLSFVKSIFDKVGGVAGYRDYLNYIVGELENNNYAIVDTPINLSKEELNQIREYIDSNNALAAALKKLVYGSKFKKFTSEQVAKCLELLVHISLQNDISEVDLLFRENSHYFQRLKNCQFLQKMKYKNKELFWAIRVQFQQVFDSIERDFGRSISDYLLKIYGGRSYKKLAVSTSDDVSVRLKPLQRFFSKVSKEIPRSVKDNIESAMRLFDTISLGETDETKREKHARNTREAMELVSRALFEIDGSLLLFKKARINDTADRWRLHWFENESLEEYYRREENYEKNHKRLDYEYLVKQGQDLFPIVVDCLKAVTEDICDPVEGSVDCLAHAIRHTNEERELFTFVQKGYFSANREKHFEYVEKVTDYLESRIRLFLYITTSLAFGQKKCFDAVPGKETKKYAHKNLVSRENYATFFNPFNGLTRPQYRSIFCDGNLIKKFIIDSMEISWQSHDWKVFFDVFVEQNIATSHQQENSFSLLDRRRYIDYCRMAEQIMVAMNLMLHNIICKHSFVIPLDDDEMGFDNIMFKFAFKLINSHTNESIPINKTLKDDSNILYKANQLEDHVLTKGAYNKVSRSIANKLNIRGSYVENLMYVDYITANYDVSFQDFVTSLVFASFIDKQINVYPWHGSNILIKKV